MRSCSEKDTSVIPRGPYCYELVTGDFMGLGRLVRKWCPYSRVLRGHSRQESGWCDYLETGDSEENCTVLLWDGCKECGINWDDDPINEDERYEP